MKGSGKYLGQTSCLKCPSSDALAIYEADDGSNNGYCFSCRSYFNQAELTGVEVQKDIVFSVSNNIKSLDDVIRNTAISDIPHRGISKETAERYGVRVAFSEINGEITDTYFPYYSGSTLLGYKVVDRDKKMYSIGTVKNADFFGQHLCGDGGKMLVITEGEYDTLAAYQIFKGRGKNYRVCSLPNGATSSSVRKKIEWIETFDTVILALDQDEIGKKTAREIADILRPGKAKVMSFTEKDANDMLLSNKGLEFFGALYNSKEHRPDGIVSVDDIFEQAIKPIEWGLSYPWPTLTKVTYGYRRKEIIGIGGASGGGKTEYAKELIDHIINVHKLPVGVIFLEEPATKTLQVLAGKKYNKRFHIPDGDWTIDELVTGINDLKGKVYLYNHFGNKGWESIKAKIRYMVVALGIKDIVLDHLTALVAQEDNEYKALNRIMEDMASLAQELDFTLFYISHLRKANGQSHEEGGRVTADQFKGSGAIVYWSNFLFGIERNQQAEDLDERNTTIFRVLKDRNTGLATGTTFKLWYDHATGRWREKTDNDGLEDF